MDEFRGIAELFAPLALPEAAGLLDDAAFLGARPGRELVITADAVVEGVHFLPGTPPDLVARKLLRVNISDLAAKAATPFGYLLSVAWPPEWADPERTAFARGLAQDQALFGLGLLGGDTVSTPGPMTASVTALGYAAEGGAVRRSGARPGDVLMVSGTIGDGWLGLQAAQGGLDLPEAAVRWLKARYQLPEPRVSLTEVLRRHAHAALDVSDGLIADLRHLARASGVAVQLELDRMPLSGPARTWAEGQEDLAVALEGLASGGDDYELAFAVPAWDVDELIESGRPVGVDLTRIGRVVEGDGVHVTFRQQVREPAAGGWRHG